MHKDSLKSKTRKLLFMNRVGQMAGPNDLKANFHLIDQLDSLYFDLFIDCLKYGLSIRQSMSVAPEIYKTVLTTYMSRDEVFQLLRIAINFDSINYLSITKIKQVMETQTTKQEPKNLLITLDQAQKIYPDAQPTLKAILETTFTKEALTPKITDRVKTFDDALIATGRHPFTYKLHMGFAGPRTKDDIAYGQLKIIAEALNEGWKPDWSNSSQYKYYPWFDLSSGFSFDDYVSDFSFSAIGGRLCFKSEELARYAGQQFLDIYKDFML